jgi:shikimate dehydrogenase
MASSMIKAAVLGKPISHSLSPLVHGLIYQELGIDHSYLRFEVDELEAEALIRRSFSSTDELWNGFSLTMPLKEVGFSLDLPIDAEAREARAINTITPEKCFNTDISGFRRVLLAEHVDFNEIVILGNGATARSALIAVDTLNDVSRITVFRRNSKNDPLLPINRRSSVSVKAIDDLGKRHLGSDVLVISTLPSSAQPSFSERMIGFEGTLVDVSYSPWPSTLAGVVAGSVISGVPLLVAQAVDQARIFSGLSFDLDSIYRSVLLSTVQRITASR